MIRIFIRGIILLGLLVNPAFAQVNLFSDDEAREKLDELEQRLDALDAQVKTLSQSSSNLTVEKQHLLEEIRALSGIVEQTNVTASRQATRIQEVDSKLINEIGLAEQRIAEEIQKLEYSLTVNPNELYAQAIEAYNARDPITAESRWREILQRFPDSQYELPTRIWLARLQIDIAEYDVAKDALLALVAKYRVHPRIPEVYNLLAEVANYQFEPLVVRYWRRQILEQFPDSAIADDIRLNNLVTTE